jgi:hypothetical protein
MPKNVMIYGSSVSRAAFGVMDSGFKLLRHVTGQSMISALSRPAALLEGRTWASPGTTVEDDIKSTLLKHVRRYASELNVLVIDLTDERHGVVHLPDGSYVTDTPELSVSGLLDTVAGKKTAIAPVTERHWTLWEASANRLFNALTELGLRDRTIVLDTPWAEVTEAGEHLGEHRELKIAELNAYLGECCAHIRSLGFTVVTMPEELRLAASEDKRDVEPFHFGAAANSWIASQIGAVGAGAPLVGMGV